MALRVGVLAALLSPVAALAGPLPRIIADAGNAVPTCVTPKALMEFVQRRNDRHRPAQSIDPKFGTIAAQYQRVGACVARPPEKCVAVRWDYAFFQMLVETNYLTFRRPDGQPAGVPARDNNFAGIGATVPGKPGERFRDPATGVLAHLQHVLMYSTTRIPQPVANRTRQMQDAVQASMRKRGRPVTYADLATMWVGSDHRAYSRTIAGIAERFAADFCRSPRVAAAR
ncbi:MAG: N-acetylmuramoyl-L-alanine amidase [Rhizobiaceae bacterium]